MSFLVTRSSFVAALLAGALAQPLAAQSLAERVALETMAAAPGPRLIAEIGVPLHSTVAPSPDGRFFAALQPRPDPVLWIIPADGAPPFPFRKSWAAYQPRWSPSGDRIGFIAAIGPPRIWTVELDPAAGRPIDPPRLLHRTGANAFAFAPDGARIALVETRSTAAGASEIRIIEWATRKVRTLLREDGAIYRLDWAPDGRSIYYAVLSADSADSSHRIVKASVRDGAATTILRAREYLGLSPNGEYLLVSPAADASGCSCTLEVVRPNGESVARIELPRGMTRVQWASNSRALLHVSATPAGDRLWEIPICPICEFVVRYGHFRPDRTPAHLQGGFQPTDNRGPP